MIDDICFVIKRGGLYFSGSEYAEPEDAWEYQSRVVFEDAEANSGQVFMILPSGRAIAVSKEDFKLSEDDDEG